VAAIKGIRIHGFFAWAMWRAIYLLKTPRFGRRVSVLADWMLNAFFRKDYTQLGMNIRSRQEMMRSHEAPESDKN
jgi:NADH dehydrogenase